MADINGIPYVESSDLVSAYPAASQALAQEVSDQLASKVDYALPVNAQTGTTYTFVAADAEKLTTASNAAAVTLTIPPASSVAWPDNTVLRIVNYGAGAVTVAGGSGVTVTNTATTIAQYQSAAAIRTGSDAWTLVPFGGGGVGDADFSDTATGTYTDGNGISWKYITYNASSTLTITKDGYADILVVGSGGGADGGRTGGGGGGVRYGTFEISSSTYTVTVASGGASATSGGTSEVVGVLSVGGGERGRVAVGTMLLSGWGGGGGSGGKQGASTSSFFAGGGAGGAASGNTPGAGVSNNYTGTSVTYGAGGAAGFGGNGSATASGGNGTVIVRVRT